MELENKNYNIFKENIENTSIYYEFAEKFLKYKREYNTNKFIFFLQVGSFYECYAWNIRNKLELFNEEYSNSADTLNMIKSYKNSKKEHSINNPRMFGFPISVKERHLTKLLNEDYTVVLASQRHCNETNKKVRDIIERFTSGTNPNNINQNNYIMSIYLDEIKSTQLACGVSLININANDNYVYECNDTNYEPNNVMNNLIKIILIYEPVEYIIYNLTNIEDTYLINLLNISNKKFVIKKHILSEYKKLDYQISFFDKIYGENSLLNSINKMNLGNLPDSRLSLLLLIKYINIQNQILLKNLKFPIFISFDDYLNVDYNTVEQLNIISDKKFEKFNIISLLDYTNRNMGKRLLKRRLMTPFANIDDIQQSYDLIEELVEINNSKLFEEELVEITDITRKHKKIYFETISPIELFNLNENYKYIINLLKLKENNPKLKNYIDTNFSFKELEIEKYIEEYENIFEVENNKFCRDIFETTTNIFKEGYNEELDKLSSQILEIKKYKKDLKNEVNKFMSQFSKRGQIVYDKTNLLFVSKAKLKIFLKKSTNVELKSKEYNKKSYIYTDKLEKYNKKEVKLLENLRQQITDSFNVYIQELSSNRLFYEKLEEIVALIDFTNSGYKCALINNYVKPELNTDTTKSNFDIQDLRHPIVEKINKNVPFISNSLKLDENTNGLLLSGLNGCGKSSLLKNIGVIIIIAQSGLYVPCKYMKYTPFNNVLTRIKGNDNIFTNSSSYTVEIQELNNILRKTNDKSLVLIDELCRGTEQASSHSLTISVIQELIEEKQSIFVLTSHMHSIFNHKIINDLKINEKLLIKHMSIEMKGDEIIYKRKLVDGPCDITYGLEIARHLGIHDRIINNATKIRNDFLKKTNDILPLKKSVYNKDLYMKSCEICKSEDRLETHHIIEQEHANDNGFLLDNNFHKNEKHNLCVLCYNCHKDITFGRIKITQRYQTTSGIKFDIIKIKNEDNKDVSAIILKLKEQKNSFKDIKNILNKKYNINLSTYKINKIYKEMIK